MIRPASALLLVLLTACGTESLVSAGLGVASLKTTRKTIADHAIGLVTDQDCSMLRAQSGDAYCLSDDEMQARIPAQPEHCYRTIGEIDCYQGPDGMGRSARLEF